MVKPTQPKGIKPKAEIKDPAESKQKLSGLGELKPVIISAAISLAISMIFVTGNYFVVKSILDNAVKQISASVNPDGGGGSDSSNDTGDASSVEEPGLILDLGDFILNLSDPKAKRYLKISMAIELSRLDTDPKQGSGGGEGGDAGMKQIEAEMSQYKPAIRDSIISILSSKTAEELSSTAGKELAKEEIKNAVNAIFNGTREVKRVSFGNFIIQ